MVEIQEQVTAEIPEIVEIQEQVTAEILEMVEIREQATAEIPEQMKAAVILILEIQVVKPEVQKPQVINYCF